MGDAHRPSAPPLTPTKPYEYDCGLCSMSFRRTRDVRIHQQIHHNGELVKPSCPWVALGICEYSTFHQGNMNVHLRTHTGETPYVCLICGKRISDPSSFRRHKERHLNSNPTRHKPYGKPRNRRHTFSPVEDKFKPLIEETTTASFTVVFDALNFLTSTPDSGFSSSPTPSSSSSNIISTSDDSSIATPISLYPTTVPTLRLDDGGVTGSALDMPQHYWNSQGPSSSSVSYLPDMGAAAPPPYYTTFMSPNMAPPNPTSWFPQVASQVPVPEVAFTSNIHPDIWRNATIFSAVQPLSRNAVEYGADFQDASDPLFPVYPFQ